MSIVNVAGYKFVSLNNLSPLRAMLLQQCQTLGLKGTILLSEEGINLSLAGTAENIDSFLAALQAEAHFSDITFRKSYSDYQPFDRIKIKIKKEIITMCRPEIVPEQRRAPHISPQLFKHWLDEKRNITILDTRNDYEVNVGTFKGAVHFQLSHFSEFPDVTQQLDRSKPIVMFCTGGVRCEKAALHLLNEGFTSVYQLDGGILNYFAEVGGAYYQGDCFVFDQRVALNSDLQETSPKLSIE